MRAPSTKLSSDVVRPSTAILPNGDFRNVAQPRQSRRLRGLGWTSFLATVFFTLLVQAAPPRLLPFQGRLTESDGAPVADGAKVVQFRIYDAPTGGNLLWPGEVHKLTVNGGLINTLLGSKADLSGVNFNQALFLEITVDAQSTGQPGHGTIDSADPPLLPRQSILPAVFAVEAAVAQNAVKLRGADWSAIMVTPQGNPASSPEGSYIKGSLLQPGSITGLQLASGTISTKQVAPAAITEEKLAPDVGTPIGSILPYAGTTPPSGYLMCNGDAYPKSKYRALSAILKNSFGGDKDNFRVPDLRGRFLRGTDDPDGPGTDTFKPAGRDPNVSDADRPPMNPGGNTGNRLGSIQSDALQSHAHNIEDPGHEHRGVIRGSGGKGGGANLPIIFGGWTNSNGEQSPGHTKDGKYVPDAFDIYVDNGKTHLTVAGPSKEKEIAAPRVSSETRPSNANVNFIIKCGPVVVEQ